MRVKVRLTILQDQATVAATTIFSSIVQQIAIRNRHQLLFISKVMLRTVIEIFISIIYPLSIAAAFARPDLGLLWRSAMHHPNSAIRPPYRAALAQCGFGDEIIDSYVVWLRYYVSLEQHLHNVALDPEKIAYSFPETFHNGLYYFAYGIDDADLEAIRGDPLVDRVDCNRALNLDRFFEGETVELLDIPPKAVVADNRRPGRRSGTVDSEL